MCVRGPRQTQAARELLEPDDLIANRPGDRQRFPFVNGLLHLVLFTPLPLICFF
jgi:hypothetical protein